MWRGAATDKRLLDAVPDSIPVIRDYTRKAKAAMVAFAAGESEASPGRSTAASRLERMLPRWLKNPELLPLSDHAPHIRYSLHAAERVLAQHQCDAIVVNADPYEGMVVGALLARRTGLPLIHDLRDPWSICELRRPMRPAPTRLLVDRIERFCVEAADAVVLNTDTTTAGYRRHYADLNPKRFSTIRNHADAGLTNAGQHPGFERFSLLFLGHFRRFVEGDVLLEALAQLKTRGLEESIRLVVTGDCPESTMRLADGLGVGAMLESHPFVPYSEIAAVMEASDLLVGLNNRTNQRIPAKFYDYVMSSRPILLIANNPELADLIASMNGAVVVGLDSAVEIADKIEHSFRAGRQQTIDRETVEYESATAGARFASILERVAR